MRVHLKAWVVPAAVAFVVGLASTAFAIEAFQERFEWGDMSKPTRIQGRVIVVDPYDKAVWLNVAVYGGNAESGLWWQRMHPGKNIKLYAKDDNVWKQLSGLARSGVGPAAAKSVPASSEATLVEVVATEPEQNYRIVHSVKTIPEVAGSPSGPVSIGSLQAGCKAADAACAAKQKLATAPKATPRMQYDVMLPGGKTIGGMIPWSADYNNP